MNKDEGIDRGPGLGEGVSGGEYDRRSNKRETGRKRRAVNVDDG
jgi:hypothetical protein